MQKPLVAARNLKKLLIRDVSLLSDITLTQDFTNGSIYNIENDKEFNICGYYDKRKFFFVKSSC